MEQLEKENVIIIVSAIPQINWNIYNREYSFERQTLEM